MFYRPADGHGLPRNPFKAIVTPRPVGWISTRDEDGTENLAPYSYFNAVADEPPQVMFASGGTKADQEDAKDSVSNVRRTGVFCVNIVEHAMRSQMNATSGVNGKDVDEFEQAGLARAPCQTIPCSRIEGAPAALECRLTEISRLRGESNGAYILYKTVRQADSSGPAHGIARGVDANDDDGNGDRVRVRPGVALIHPVSLTGE